MHYIFMFVGARVCVMDVQVFALSRPLLLIFIPGISPNYIRNQIKYAAKRLPSSLGVFITTNLPTLRLSFFHTQ